MHKVLVGRRLKKKRKKNLSLREKPAIFSPISVKTEGCLCLDCKEVQLVHPEGDQSWVFIGSTDAEAETPILWPLDAKNYSLEKTLMLGKIEGGRRGQQRMRWLDGITDSMDMS